MLEAFFLKNLELVSRISESNERYLMSFRSRPVFTNRTGSWSTHPFVKRHHKHPLKTEFHCSFSQTASISKPPLQSIFSR